MLDASIRCDPSNSNAALLRRLQKQGVQSRTARSHAAVVASTAGLSNAGSSCPALPTSSKRLCAPARLKALCKARLSVSGIIRSRSPCAIRKGDAEADTHDKRLKPSKLRSPRKSASKWKGSNRASSEVRAADAARSTWPNQCTTACTALDSERFPPTAPSTALSPEDRATSDPRYAPAEAPQIPSRSNLQPEAGSVGAQPPHSSLQLVHLLGIYGLRCQAVVDRNHGHPGSRDGASVALSPCDHPPPWTSITTGAFGSSQRWMSRFNPGA